MIASGTNAARGEASVVLDGTPRRLCLTLGALAEIEQALGADGIEALAARLRRLTAGDLAAVLAALLAGGGVDPETAERLARDSDPRVAAEGVAAAFAAAAP